LHIWALHLLLLLLFFIIIKICMVNISAAKETHKLPLSMRAAKFINRAAVQHHSLRLTPLTAAP